MIKRQQHPFVLDKYQDHQRCEISILFISCLLMILILFSSCGTQSPTKSATASSESTAPVLYLLSTTGNLVAYRANGKQLWHSVAASSSFRSLSNGRTHLLVDGQTIYTATDMLQATAANGRVLWHQNLSDIARDLLKVGNVLYVIEGTSLCTLSAWDSTQGKLLWQRKGTTLPIGPWSPLKSDGKLLFLGGVNQVVAVKLQTGNIAWQRTIDPGDGVENVYVEQNTLLVQTGTKLIALQPATGQLRWQRDSQIQSLYLNQAGSILYTISIDILDPTVNPNVPIWSGLRAIDVTTGKPYWSISQQIALGSNSDITAAGFLYSDGTSLTAWDLSGKRLWQNPYVGARIMQIGAMAQTALIIGQDGAVTALDSQNGSQRWQQTTFQGQSYQLATYHNQFWICSKDDGKIAVYSIQGTKQWSLSGLSPFEDIDVI